MNILEIEYLLQLQIAKVNGKNVDKIEIEKKLMNLTEPENKKIPFTMILKHRKTCFRSLILLILS